MSQTMRHRKSFHGLYPTPDGGGLFLPTIAMWRVNQQARPRAVLRRAGLSPETWAAWKRAWGESDPWFFDWLYSFRAVIPNAASPSFVLPAGATLFRQKAAMHAIARATGRGKGKAVTHVQICYYLRAYRGLRWFRPWLLRGEAPPANVRILSAAEIRRCQRAFDYLGHCRQAGLKPDKTYVRWIGKHVPDPSWLWWLYGARPPEGAFVVPPSLQRLREETFEKSVCAAADLSLTYLSGRKKNATFMRALQEASQAAVRPGAGGRADALALPALDRRRREAVIAYATAAALKARCDRADMDTSTYYHLLEQARSLGLAETVQHYVHSTGPFSGKATLLRRGLVAPNFFVPSAGMLDFRKAASAALAKEQLSNRKNLPGFSDLFLDWVIPWPAHGRRAKLVPSNDTEPRRGEDTSTLPAALVPSWDEEQRQLWLGGRLLKAFRQPAGNQIRLIEAFHRAGWPQRIPNPFQVPGPQGTSNPDAEKLNNTCKWLNNDLPRDTIRFCRDGTGAGVCWERCNE